MTTREPTAPVLAPESTHHSLLQLIHDKLDLNSPFLQGDDPEAINQVRELMDRYNQQADQDPTNQPEEVIARIVSQYFSAHRLAAKTPTSLNSIIARYDVGLQRFRKVDLSPYDEVALLKATVYAGFSRGTKSGYVLARKAIRILHHEATNIALPTSEYNKLSDAANLSRLARAIYSSKAIDELYEVENSRPVVNVDDALRGWRELVDSAQPTETDTEDDPIISAEEYVEEESRVSLRRLLNIEAENRLKGLRVIGDRLKEAFGEEVNIRYFETVVFADRESVETPLPDEDEGEQEEIGGEHHEKDSQDDKETSSYFGSDYVLAEVTQTLEDGSKLIHIIAESPNYSNACYVLRGDTLAAIGEAIGENIDWRTVFSFPKVTARQLGGAMNFRHTNGKTVPEKVLNYLALDVPETLKPVARRWFTGAKPIYNESLEPTRYNRLPSGVKERITPKLEQIREIILPWGGVATAQEAKELGTRAVTGGGVERPETPLPEELSGVQAQELVVQNEQLKLDKMHLEQANKELNQRIDELQRRLASIAALSDSTTVG